MRTAQSPRGQVVPAGEPGAHVFVRRRGPSRIPFHGSGSVGGVCQQLVSRAAVAFNYGDPVCGEH